MTISNQFQFRTKPDAIGHKNWTNARINFLSGQKTDTVAPAQPAPILSFRDRALESGHFVGQKNIPFPIKSSNKIPPYPSSVSLSPQHDWHKKLYPCANAKTTADRSQCLARPRKGICATPEIHCPERANPRKLVWRQVLKKRCLRATKEGSLCRRSVSTRPSVRLS